MLSPNGEIDFTQEILDLADGFIADYQQRQGTLNSDLERGLIIAYILGVLRCDLEHVWDSLGQAEVFGSLKPRLLFQECGQRENKLDPTRQTELLRQMIERGWFSPAPCDEK